MIQEKDVQKMVAAAEDFKEKARKAADSMGELVKNYELEQKRRELSQRNDGYLVVLGVFILAALLYLCVK